MQSKLFIYDGNAFETIDKGIGVMEDSEVQLALCFASKKILQNPQSFAAVKSKFTHGNVLMCSTAGEICNNRVFDDSMVIAALTFQQTVIRCASVKADACASSYEAAGVLLAQLPMEGLSYIMVFSDGSKINGSELVRGINEKVGSNILVTGGLAGDGANFKSTLVGVNHTPEEGQVVALGFYGNALQVSHGSMGGWENFGPERIVTKSVSNVLYEIDGQSALDLYKKYLGPESENLPSSALLFPLSVLIEGNTNPVVRTILSINNEDKSMIFAGDIPEGSKVRFMKANFDKLTQAAYNAAASSHQNRNYTPEFALLISCVGRKLILGPRIEEEVESVRDLFGPNTMLAGFYSYGEISPFNLETQCQLHNQTMTITTFHEVE